MENDLRKKEFAEKYRMLLHNQEVMLQIKFICSFHALMRFSEPILYNSAALRFEAAVAARFFFNSNIVCRSN